MHAGWSPDLCNTDEDRRLWDFTQRDVKNKANHNVLENKPLVIIGWLFSKPYSAMFVCDVSNKVRMQLANALVRVRISISGVESKCSNFRSEYIRMFGFSIQICLDVPMLNPNVRVSKLNVWMFSPNGLVSNLNVRMFNPNMFGCSDAPSECAGVESECSDVQSECSGVESECSDAQSESSGVESECSDVRSADGRMFGFQSECAGPRPKHAWRCCKNTSVFTHK